MARIQLEGTADAPAAVVFGYVDDWTNTTKYMQGLTKWEPAGEVTHGLGATFDAAMQVGPTSIDSVLEITTWEQDRALGWEPRKGIKQSGTWRFQPAGDRTLVTIVLDVTFPGGIAGRLLGKTTEPILRSQVQKSLTALTEQVERLPR